eukprot:TRINITY_DN12572_c1_g1_i1.p1 TRINITY_DN12572_c1_g1~~TRINITY_DN12572_c1_g1_i1.p1  ORF type:complete len:812 (+),score=152.30 TRINITY_DN12572_c1_g1_i1:147-2582(+)
MASRVGATAMAAAGAPTAIQPPLREYIRSSRIDQDVDIDLGESLPLGGSGLSKAFRRSLLRRAGIRLPPPPRDNLVQTEYDQSYIEQPGAEPSGKHVRFRLPSKSSETGTETVAQQPQPSVTTKPKAHQRLTSLGRGTDLPSNEADIMPVYPQSQHRTVHTATPATTTVQDAMTPDPSLNLEPSEYVVQYRQPTQPAQPSKWARRRPPNPPATARMERTPESEYDLMFQWPTATGKAVRRHLMASDIRTLDNTTAAAAMHLHPNDAPHTTTQRHSYSWQQPVNVQSRSRPTSTAVQTQPATDLPAPPPPVAASAVTPTSTLRDSSTQVASEYDAEYHWPSSQREKGQQTDKPYHDAAAQVSPEDLQQATPPPRVPLRYQPVSEYDRSFGPPSRWRSYWSGPRMVDASTATPHQEVHSTVPTQPSHYGTHSQPYVVQSSAGRPVSVAGQLHDATQHARLASSHSPHRLPAESRRALRNASTTPTVRDARYQRPAGLSSQELDSMHERGDIFLPQQHTATYDTEYQQQYMAWQPAPRPHPHLPSNLGPSEYDDEYRGGRDAPQPDLLPLPRPRAGDLPGHLDPATIKAQDQAYAQPYVVQDWYQEMAEARQAAQRYMERDRRLDHVGQRLAEIGREQERLLAEQQAKEQRREQSKQPPQPPANTVSTSAASPPRASVYQPLQRQPVILDDTYDKDKDDHKMTTDPPSQHSHHRFEELTPAQLNSNGSWREQSDAYELQDGYITQDDVALAASQSFEYMTDSSVPNSYSELQQQQQQQQQHRHRQQRPQVFNEMEPVNLGDTSWVTLPRHYPTD